MKNQQEFHATFILNPYICFDVNYYTLGNNKTPYFTTNASMFNKIKSDWNQCGQAQESLLPNFTKAFIFYEKWDKKHLMLLNEAEYTELVNDLADLISCYKCHILSYKDISFNQKKELSKLYKKMNK